VYTDFTLITHKKDEVCLIIFLCKWAILRPKNRTLMKDFFGAEGPFFHAIRAMETIAIASCKTMPDSI
jgi:hypothetical protein